MDKEKLNLEERISQLAIEKISPKVQRIKGKYLKEFERKKREYKQRIESNLDEEQEKVMILEELEKCFRGECFYFSFKGTSINAKTKEKYFSIARRSFEIMDVLEGTVREVSCKSHIEHKVYSPDDIKEDMVIKVLLWGWVKGISKKSTIEKSLPKAVKLNFHLLDLDTIGKKCDPLLKEGKLLEAFNLTKEEFISRKILLNFINRFKLSFNNGLKNTPNKKAFIASQKANIIELIESVIGHEEDYEKKQKYIYDGIVNNKTGLEVLNSSYFFLNGITFAKYFYVVDLIKVLCYIDGGKWENEDSITQRNILKKEDVKMDRVCCDLIVEILNNALNLGITKNELNVFKKHFDGHRLTEFGRSEFRNKKMVDVVKLVDKIFDIADIFEEEVIQEYFINAAFKDIMQNNNNAPYWSETKMRFKKVFKEKRKGLEAKDTTVQVDEDNSFDFDRELEQIKETENDFWKGYSMKNVINHFRVFTDLKSKNGKHFLTEVQFLSFLKRGFLKDETEPKQKINFKYGEKGLVVRRFYEFFIILTDYEFSQKQKQKITDLIMRCFCNADFTESNISELLKPNGTKKRWENYT
jgi:hypothetical protein